MIKLSKIVDNKAINAKLNIAEIERNLKNIETDLNVILCVTREPRKYDEWTKEGKKYVSLILDYNKVLYAQHKFVLKYALQSIEKAIG